jgi:hypothetical protein
MTEEGVNGCRTHDIREKTVGVITVAPMRSGKIGT